MAHCDVSCSIGHHVGRHDAACIGQGFSNEPRPAHRWGRSTRWQAGRWQRRDNIKMRALCKEHMKFAGKVVVITGASSGIGRQAAIDFAKHGANSMILVSRSKQKLSQLAGEIKSRSSCNTVPYVCDVSDKAQVLRMGTDILNRFDRVDVLVNDAGFAVFKSVKNLSIEEIESMTATNYYGM